MDHVHDDIHNPKSMPPSDWSALLLCQLQHEVNQGRLTDRTRSEPVPPMLLLDLLSD
jgi:hypothetical protein